MVPKPPKPKPGPNPPTQADAARSSSYITGRRNFALPGVHSRQRSLIGGGVSGPGVTSGSGGGGTKPRGGI